MDISNPHTHFGRLDLMKEKMGEKAEGPAKCLSPNRSWKLEMLTSRLLTLEKINPYLFKPLLVYLLLLFFVLTCTKSVPETYLVFDSRNSKSSDCNRLVNDHSAE